MDNSPFSRHRFIVIIGILFLIVSLVVGRLFYLAQLDRSFLQNKAAQEANHVKLINAERGLVLDRNGVPLAISAPIDNIIFDPRLLSQSPDSWYALAANPALGLNLAQIKALVMQDPNSQYVIAKKEVPPAQAQSIDDMNIPGVYIEKNYESFYPFGPATAQLIGFTNLNDAGQDGLELSYNRALQSDPGKEFVTENAIGQVLSINQVLSRPHPGKDLYLSIDSRIQYVAYQALQNEVISAQADSGSVVVLDPHTGEVLAAVSYPSFNPNSFTDRSGPFIRDRAMTDTFEPGSTVKVLTLAAALDSGKYGPHTPIDTNPGFYFIGQFKIRDDSNFGLIDTTGVLTKSSNVGISRIALSLPRDLVYSKFIDAGIGRQPSGAFPGEASGFIYPQNSIGDFQFATMTFGYSVSVSLLQLARVYAAIANDGVILPITFVKNDSPLAGTRIMKSSTAQTLIQMLETVVGPQGTGILANVPGYLTAGKTGTAHQAAPQGGYYKNRYNTLFVGMIPADHPVVVIAVRIDNPKGHFNTFGGVSSAPVFSQIAEACMHLFGIPPDKSQVDLTIFKNQKDLLQQLVEA